MGVESAVYRFAPTSGDSGAAVDALTNLRAVRVNDDQLVLRGSDHWIDIQVNRPWPSVWLRVAFANPPGVINELRAAVGALDASGGGEVIDMERRARFASSDDEALEELLHAFSERRDAFQRDFGPFTAAVSADDVFRLLRESQTDG